MWESENQLVSIFWSSFLLSKGELAAWPWHVCIQLNIQTAVSRCTWQNSEEKSSHVGFLSFSIVVVVDIVSIFVPRAESVGLVHLVWSARDGVQFSSMQCSWAAMVRLIHPCVSMRGAVVPLLCALSAMELPCLFWLHWIQPGVSTWAMATTTRECALGGIQRGFRRSDGTTERRRQFPV